MDPVSLTLLAAIGVGVAAVNLIVQIAGGIARAFGAADRINQLILDLESARDGLQEQLDATEKDRVRELRQADDLLEAERTSILAQYGVEDVNDIFDQLEDEVRRRAAEVGMDADALQRQIDDIEEDRQDALEEVDRLQRQAGERRQMDVEHLQERIAAGEAEAQRRVTNIIQNRDTFLSQTKDQAILQLNNSGVQLEAKLSRVVTEGALTVGEAAARIAGSAVRRTGSPLLAYRQIERTAREERRAAQQQELYEIQAEALGFKQKVTTAKETAKEDVEDTMAANAMRTQELNQQIESTEQAFGQNYENLEASREDINREARQATAAVQGQLDMLNLRWQHEEERLREDANKAAARLEADLAMAVLTTEQRKEDIVDQADILTAQYRRQIADAERHRTSLVEGRGAIILAEALSAGSSILGSVQSFLDSLPAAQPATQPTASGQSGVGAGATATVGF